MGYVNITGYQFVTLTDLEKIKYQLQGQCQRLLIKGTILLAKEGINLMLAGTRDSINAFIQLIRQLPAFADLTFKENFSDKLPFAKLKVRIKPEIITLGLASIKPDEQAAAPYLPPEQLQTWLDEQRDLTLLDVRNRHEVKCGTFCQAIDLKLEHFREFPKASQQLDPTFTDKPVVIFCTGGIRCEKASIVLAQQGFNQVCQLEGGILNYFKLCGGSHYQGDCFVFDDRIVLNPQLECVVS